MKIISELRSASGITAALAVLMTLLEILRGDSYCRDSGIGTLSLMVAGLSIITFVLAIKAKREAESLENIEKMRRRGEIK
jgi:hypothetical protein